MRPSVRDAFVKFTETFEGSCSWMYCDVKGLVTTGIGNLIDPVGAALPLPWLRPDGSSATPGEIIAAWQAVKAREDLTQHGGGAYRNVSNLRLSEAGIQQVVLAKLLQNDAFLKKRFTDWETWPADAQLATLSMAWAAGPGFNFPKFQRAAFVRDWGACAIECHMDDWSNPGLTPRNLANKKLFQNAAEVGRINAAALKKGTGVDPGQLFYPGSPTQTSETFPGQ
jgi:GH24 family phage-related lysozyme (muramidase)